ncbi:MAG: copper homeostasis protein CutC [Cetobacterium sp.]|uniref:copper homeostasis protein CutC n=1 Tax=Cetobacterium sp. TaxID=2071632 RepID=UPI002FC98839
MLKEACVESYLEAKIAESKGANRIELCENLAQGGTTPSYGTIKSCLKYLNIPFFVMIRPRGGDFCYSKDEIEIMKDDITLCKSLGVKGIVIGVLNNKKEIDYPLLKELISLAKPMKITFHKAIDEVENPINAIPNLIELGIDRILTSGKHETALAGKDILNKMITLANGKIIIIAAGKITHENFNEISSLINTHEFHGKKIV